MTRGLNSAGINAREEKRCGRRRCLGGIELRSDADLSFYGDTDPESSLVQFVRLPRFAKLEKAAVANSSFRGDPGSGAGLVLHPRILTGDEPREIEGVGPKWEELLA
ncbi:hypothetical protein, partial [Corynebacterium sp. HMSC29G08]|uniref:hypothetical protein n=1 Tax=Corynebacterium sp. HMSC29G08 TaxID=1581069 RepID=UPI001AEFF79C